MHSVVVQISPMPLRLRTPTTGNSVIALFSNDNEVDYARARAVAQAFMTSPDEQQALTALLSALDRMEARTPIAEKGPTGGTGDPQWERDLLRVLRG